MLKYFITFIFGFFIISISYSLKISEVYFDGSNEYIGLYSQNGFSGNVILSGAKKSTFSTNLNIKPKEEFILGDKAIGTYFTGFNNFYTGLSLSISDTRAINIQLIYSGQVIDTFFVSKNEVNKLNNKKTAFQKFFSGNKEFIELVKKPINTKKGYIGNPGYVVFSGNVDLNNSQSTTGDNSTSLYNNLQYLDCGYYLIKKNSNIKTCSLGQKEVLNCFIELDSKKDGFYSLSFTGNKIFTGVNWFIDNKFYTSGLHLSNYSGGYIKAVGKYKNYTCTGTFYIEKQTKKFGKLIVNEINLGKNNLSEYVELKSIGSVSGNILFSGFSNKNFILPIKTYSGQLLVLSKNYSGFLYTGNVIKVPNLSLKDNNGRLIIKKTGQVLDSVFYKDKNSRYYYYSFDGIRYFYKTGQDSPGFENFATKYYKTKQVYNCNIVYQSFNNGKLNLTSKVSNMNICQKQYRQIWTYSGGIITGTCNPYPISVNSKNQKITLQIFSGNNLLCADSYNFFYDTKIVKKQIIQTKIETKVQEPLNCSVKIQGKDGYFFDKDPLNFISLVNQKEIQNSNNNYTCSYFLDGNLLSNKCNPSSKNIESGLHSLKLSITSNTGLVCQTTIDLNIPKLSDDYIVKHFSIDNFKNLLAKLKLKYSQRSLKKITQPISYLYTGENYINSLNTTELIQLVGNIKNKYKSDSTLKKIFNPISYLYKTNIGHTYRTSCLNYITPLNCAKLNSTELNQLIENINNKYKTKYTLNKIFKPISYLYLNTSSSGIEKCVKLNSNELKTIVQKVFNKYKSESTLKKIFLPAKKLYVNDNRNFTGNIKIFKIIPETSGNYLGKGKQAIIISGHITGTLLTGLSIGTEKRKYKLSNYILTGKNYLFTGQLGLSKSKCLNLYLKKQIVDTVCYIKRGQSIGQIFRPKNGIIFKNNYIISNFQILENKSLISLKKKIRKVLKLIEIRIKRIEKDKRQLNKYNEKLYNQYVKSLARYYILKGKYSLMKNTLENKNKDKYFKLRQKNKEIKILKKTRAFLKSFIVYNKKYIPKDIYRQYLDKYKKVILGKKVEF